MSFWTQISKHLFHERLLHFSFFKGRLQKNEHYFYFIHHEIHTACNTVCCRYSVNVFWKRPLKNEKSESPIRNECFEKCVQNDMKKTLSTFPSLNDLFTVKKDLLKLKKFH